MKFVRFYLSIAVVIFDSLFSSNISHAQCSHNFTPNYLTFVNGTDTIVTAGLQYYVGSGDSAFVIPQTAADFFVDGGYVEFLGGSLSFIHAKNGSTIKFPNGTGPFFLYREPFANIINFNNGQNNICSPLIFNFVNTGINSVLGNFSVATSNDCAGLTINSLFYNYIPGSTVISSFGDGTADTAFVLNNSSVTYTHLYHTYSNTGFYLVKQVLYNGGNPIDSIDFLYHYKFCSTMPVTLYNDVNGNCVYDQGLDNTTFQPIQIEVDSVNVPIDTISCTSGFTYTAYGAAGDIYKFKIISLPGDMVSSCPITGVISDTLYQGVNSTRYLGLSCPGGGTAFDLSMNVKSRAGSHAFESNITLQNEFCMGHNGTLTMHYDTSYHMFYGNPLPVSQTLGTAVWNISSISGSLQSPKIHVRLDGAQMAYGTLVTTTYTLTPTVGDLNPSNNALVVIDTAKSGFDPNAIYVNPGSCVQPGANLEYKITFENTGNAPAENIYVLDTLPAGLDASSLKLKFASHSMFIEKIYLGTQTVLKFNFPNIMLPDSSDHAGCHGSFIYSINARNDYPIGSSIDHRAGIYFDYNLPVLTNTASTLMCWPQNVATTTPASQGNILIYPNPATDELTIEADGSFTNYTITNNLGQVMISEKLKGKTTRSIRSLPTGVYYITLKGEKGSETRKFVKM